jgi:hypothetical protein
MLQTIPVIFQQDIKTLTGSYRANIKHILSQIQVN